MLGANKTQNLFLAALTLSVSPIAMAQSTKTTTSQIVVHDKHVNDVDTGFAQDYTLKTNEIRMQFDGYDKLPMLNVGQQDGGTAVVVGEPVVFDTYWNYGHWIDRAEITIEAKTASGIKMDVAVVPVDVETRKASWIMPDFSDATQITYRLRVYDAKGNFDETVTKYMRRVDRKDDIAPVAQSLSPIYGEDASKHRNIRVTGGAVTVSSLNTREKNISDIQVFGKPVILDVNGSFAVQEILPVGEHTINVSYLRGDGKRINVKRTVELPETDLFVVALGDLTIGTRGSDSRALLEAAGNDFDETFVTGRAAFYLKGKVKGDYLLTASMDTTEDDIDNLFSNLSEKDAQSLLRRVDPNRYYPVYGDDSTYYEDAPTQGRFYIRVERGDDHVIWGNFFTNVTDTEFSQIDRGLYGAKVEYNADESTSFGERKTQATLYAADPGTLPAREEYLATGGSVYFLERQDLTIGSERVRVEVRDRDSGLVLETRDLAPFVDYEIDYIQGRILLTSPLNSSALTSQIVRDGALSGNSVFVVARYEYTPLLTDVDGYNAGGRIETWANDNVRLGVVAQSEQTADADQEILAADILVRKTEDTYFKAEVAQSEGNAFDEQVSFDGGFTYDTLSSGRNDGPATAWRVEGAATLSDLSENGSDRTRITGYYEDLEAGFSGVGRLTQGDTQRFGASVSTAMSEDSSIDLKYDDVSIDGGIDELTAALDVRFGLRENLKAGIGIRYNDVSGSAISNDGARTDLGLELRYEPNEEVELYGFAQGTVDSSQSREDSNRGGVGFETQLTDAFRLRSEVSGGDGGMGAIVEGTWQRSDGEQYYLNYGLDAERQEPGLDGNSFLSNTQNALTFGGRKRYNSSVSVYGEERMSFGDTQGLTHAYGLDFRPAEHWTLGLSLEVGEVETFDQLVEREAYTVSAGRSGEDVNFGAAFEWLQDESGGAVKETWLFRSNFGYKVSPDWRALLKFNKAESNNSGGSFFDGEFTEAQIAGAYRPVDNNRLNGLLRYTFYEDRPTAVQVSSSGQTALPSQRSHIFSVDGDYVLNDWLTLGGKVGHRSGSVNLSRTSDQEVDSEATLLVGRADIHVVKRWDALIEARMLDVDLAQDKKMGVLAAVYRHVGENMKVGIGYNFTDFSDDLTDLTYDDDGVFLNIVAKF